MSPYFDKDILTQVALDICTSRTDHGGYDWSVYNGTCALRKKRYCILGRVDIREVRRGLLRLSVRHRLVLRLKTQYQGRSFSILRIMYIIVSFL